LRKKIFIGNIKTIGMDTNQFDRERGEKPDPGDAFEEDEGEKSEP
jgi:hypothetical protein